MTLDCPWNAYTFEALGAGGALPAANDFSAAALWVWGEGGPDEIPRFEGERVVLLGPPSHARPIQVQRKVATLWALLEARALADREVSALLARIERANAK